MTDATNGLPVYNPDPDFGRSYRAPGDAMPEVRLPAGWWLLPAVATGVLGWAALFWAVLL